MYNASQASGSEFGVSKVVLNMLSKAKHLCLKGVYLHIQEFKLHIQEINYFDLTCLYSCISTEDIPPAGVFTMRGPCTSLGALFFPSSLTNRTIM